MSIRDVSKARLGEVTIVYEIGPKSNEYDHDKPERNLIRATPDKIVAVSNYAGGVSIHLDHGLTVGTEHSLEEVLAFVARSKPETPVIITTVNLRKAVTDAGFCKSTQEKEKHYVDAQTAFERLQQDPEAYSSRKQARPPVLEMRGL